MAKKKIHSCLQPTTTARLQKLRGAWPGKTTLKSGLCSGAAIREGDNSVNNELFSHSPLSLQTATPVVMYNVNPAI